jgi:hypothetical protein
MLSRYCLVSVMGGVCVLAGCSDPRSVPTQNPSQTSKVYFALIDHERFGDRSTRWYDMNAALTSQEKNDMDGRFRAYSLHGRCLQTPSTGTWYVIATDDGHHVRMFQFDEISVHWQQESGSTENKTIARVCTMVMKRFRQTPNIPELAADDASRFLQVHEQTAFITK